MKKRFTGILMCMMLLCMSVLAGCSLVEPNYYDYYNQAVAVVEYKKTGEQYDITKRDLISAYQSYGYTYEQYYSYTREEAIKETLKLLENRKITLLTAEEKFGISQDGEGLTEKEKTYLYQQTVDSLNDNLKNYYDDIIGATDSEEESDDITFNGYTKNATLYPDLSIHRIDHSNDLLADFSYTVPRDFYNQEDNKLIYENFIESLMNDNYKKAFNYYLRDLKASERGMGLSTDAKSVFEREIDRLYKVLYENYVVERYSLSNQNSESLSSITASQIVNLYTSKVRASYTQYVIEKDSGYDEDVQNSLSSTYYFRTDEDATKFYTVANVLFKFTDEQQTEYNNYKSKYEEGDGKSYTYEQYQNDLDRLYSQITPVVRKYNEETGVYEEVENSDLTIDDIYKIMNDKITSDQVGGDVNKIGDTINDFIYLYNEDTGMFNAETNYVIGINKDDNGEPQVVSSFVDEFNDAFLKLYEDNNDGKDLKVGDMTGFVRTEYGIHVIIYTGECKNLFDAIDGSFELNEEAVQTLYNTRVNILVDKTYFDVMYDLIYQDNYQYFENANLNFLRENYNIYEYSGRYADLLG